MTVNDHWSARIDAANKYYQEWSNLYKCEMLERYYRGFQWRQNVDINVYKPYTLNLVFATIKIKLASILMQNPEFLITPRPGKMNYNQDFAVQSAQIKQDTLNTVIDNPNANFTRNIKLAALDSFFRFGIVETGYAADWQNPKKKDLIANDDSATVEDSLEVPIDERLYWKRIRASRFRVAVSDDPFLNNCEWCGYYTWMLKSTLENTKGIKMPTDYKSQHYSYEYSDIISSFKDKQNENAILSALHSGEVYKVWNIWNHRKLEKYLILDGPFEEIWQGEYERLPFQELRWDDDLEGWYPIPPVWHWISPQNEINQTREQMRNYRRRFIRKFTRLKGAVDSLEFEKLTSDVDGESIEIKREGAISALANPEIGISIQQDLAVSMNDFNLISATSSNAREQVDRTTATESKIIDVRSQIRESAEQMDFSTFINAVGRESLLQIGERFSEGMWIKYNMDPGEEFLGELQASGPIFKYITAAHIEDGYDFDIDVNVTNAVPARMAEEEAKFMKFMGIMMQFPQIALSPKLTREAAYRVGYRNEAIIKEFQKAALMRMMAQAAASQQQPQPGVQGSQGATPESIQGSMAANTQPVNGEMVQ